VRFQCSVEKRYDLKANQNFLKLQDELASTEIKFDGARTRFNESVKPYNTHIKTFPNSIFCRNVWPRKSILMQLAQTNL
jgi:LemA protein